MDDPDARVPMSAVVSLLSAAVDVTGDDNLGLTLARRVDLGALDVHFYAMLSSPTLGAAYACLPRYQRLIHDTTRVVRHGLRVIARTVRATSYETVVQACSAGPRGV